MVSKMKAETMRINLDPGQIVQMAGGYWVSQVLYVATRLNIFTLLEGKELTLARIVQLLDIPSASCEKLLNACCALDLLHKEDDRYRNSSLSERFLVEGKDGYLGYFVFLIGQLYTTWGGLLEAIKKDKPMNARFGKGTQISDKDARFFTLAMHSNSSLTAPHLADTVDLSHNKRLLDVGGGSGINAIVLAERNPHLEAVIYDFPAVIKVANEFIAKSKAADRIGLKAGDYNRNDLPEGFDCLLLSHILHGEGEKNSRALLKKCYDILEPSGKIIIVDFLLNEDKTAPVFSALFSLNMLLETPDGDTFSAYEITQFLKDAGFNIKEIKSLGEFSPAKVVVATKPI